MIQYVSKKIHSLRKSHSLTQERLGALIGVTSQAISKWENGDNLPDIAIIPKLCQIFEVSADELLGVSRNVLENEFVSDLSGYVKRLGSAAAAFEACRMCIDENAFDSFGGMGAFDGRGYAVVLADDSTVTSVLNPPFEAVDRICKLIVDRENLKVLATRDCSVGRSEGEIAHITGLESNAVTQVLFKLLKGNVVKCTPDDKYILGESARQVLFALAGMSTCN